jgi:N-acetylglucosaminyl-diphospho-decaprenol L-rhamnosyltransferase
VATLTPELSIGIVLHNSADTLAMCLWSVRDAVDRGWAEVIAVDNDSPDDSVGVLRRELPHAQLLTLDRNRGFAAGANAALARAEGRYWLLLNPDVRGPTDGLETLVEWMDRHPRHGLASPEIVGADGHWQSPGRAPPSIARTLMELTRLHRVLPRRVRGRLLRGPYWTGGDQLDAGWVPGTSMIVRPQAAREVGPLREDLFMYGEDLEWCWRMRRAGWRIGVCSGTTFVHQTGSSARATFGEPETQRRIAAGIDGACRSIYGPGKARLLAALIALSLLADSAAPGRDPAQRARARSAARIWRQLARREPSH